MTGRERSCCRIRIPRRANGSQRSLCPDVQRPGEPLLRKGPLRVQLAGFEALRASSRLPFKVDAWWASSLSCCLTFVAQLSRIAGCHCLEGDHRRDRAHAFGRSNRRPHRASRVALSASYAGGWSWLRRLGEPHGIAPHWQWTPNWPRASVLQPLTPGGASRTARLPSRPSGVPPPVPSSTSSPCRLDLTSTVATLIRFGLTIANFGLGGARLGFSCRSSGSPHWWRRGGRPHHVQHLGRSSRPGGSDCRE